MPVRNAPGWRALGFPPRLWAAPKRIPGAGAGGGGRGRDTTMVIRRLCVIVVTVYLALTLVVLSRLA